VEEDEIMSEVFSSLQGGVVVERHLAASGEQLRVVDAVSKSSRSDIVLHMHFNYRQFAENALWFVEETRLCHPDNFLACLFVSDWDSADLPDLHRSQHGSMVRFFDCPSNGPVTIPSTNAT
jgi:hypothetical protein